MKDRYIVTLIALSILVALMISAFAPVSFADGVDLPEYKNVSFTVINKTQERLIVYMTGVERGFSPRLLVNPGTQFTPNKQTWRIPNDIYSIETWYGVIDTNVPVGRCLSRVDASYMPGEQVTRYYDLTKPARMVVTECYDIMPEIQTLYEQNVAEGLADKVNAIFNWAFKFVY